MKIPGWITQLGLTMALAASPLNAQQSDSDSPDNNTPLAEQPTEASANETTTNSGGDLTASEDSQASKGGRKGLHREAIIVIGQDATLKPEDSADAVVVIGGSAKIEGRVNDSVVTILGDANIQGGDVRRETVSVLGNIRAGQGARLRGDVVAVGGKVEVADDAKVEGRTQELDFGEAVLPKTPWIKNWLLHCVLKLRPLAPQVGWVWAVAAFWFVIYLLVAAVFRRPVQACVNELTDRPATTFIIGFLTPLLLSALLFVLAITVVGALLIPFVLAALVVAGIIGKVGILEALGLRFLGRFSLSPDLQPVIALIVGAACIALLYLVPILGLVTFLIIGVWAMGGVVTAAFGSARRELPRKAPTAVTPPQPTPPPEPFPTTTMPGTSSTNPTGTPIAAEAPAAIPMAASQPNVPDVLAYPRAGFWERIGAAFLDLVVVFLLVSLCSQFVGRPPLPFIIALAYFAGFWAWKGTTIGGIVSGLKVVRTDGQPLTLIVALVRGLAAALSVVVFFLGFFWIAWDREQQGWHDKIAGTVVLRVPRSAPLVCV